MPQTRQLAAIMFTDIVGYTALMGEDEQKAFQLLTKNRELQKPIIQKYNGKWIKEIGDGVLASFTTVSDAVYSALEIQQQCKQSCEFSLRIGIHLGEIVFEDDDVFGDAVNVASRIQAIAPAGGIYISETVHNDVANKAEIRSNFIRKEKLKNVKEPVRIYEVIPNTGKNLQNTAIARSSRNRRILKIPFHSIGVIVIPVIILLLGLLFFTNLGKGLFTKAAVQSIAVLPFINESGNPDLEYLSDGMTETLISSLSQLNNLKVKARTSVFRYKGKDIDVQKIGNELNVQAILSGRIIQRGKDLALSLWLVDTRTEEDLWSKQYNRDKSNLVTLQTEIAGDVADNLKAKLSGEDKRQLSKNYTENEEAYQLYLQGLYHWNKRTAEDIRKSIMLFQNAIDKDPLYAKAYAGLASAYLVLPGYSRNLTKQEVRELDLKRRAAVRRAKELDDSLAEVHAILGTIYEDDWNLASAENEYKQAIELNPNFASAHQFYSVLLSRLGRHDEAEREINKAYELDPFSISINFSIGGQLYFKRRFDEAIKKLTKVLEMEPNHSLTHLILAQAYEAKNIIERAIRHRRIADVLLKEESAADAERKTAELSRALKVGGAQGYWRKQLEFSLQENDRGYGSAYNTAIIYARLGDKDRAFEQLEKSYTAREWDLLWIKSEPAFDSIRSDPRFNNLLRRIGLPE